MYVDGCAWRCFVCLVTVVKTSFKILIDLPLDAVCELKDLEALEDEEELEEREEELEEEELEEEEEPEEEEELEEEE